MKRFLLSILGFSVICSVTTATAQEDDITSFVEEEEERCYKLIEEQQFDAAISAAQGLMDFVQYHRSQYDTLMLLPLQVKTLCYTQNKDFDNLLVARQECLDIFENGGYTDRIDYPYYIGLKASTYWLLDLNAEADSIIQKAVALYDERMPNNNEMAFTLSIQGRIKHDLEQYDSAILFSQRALNIYQSIYNVHHELVTSELEYLKQYYEEAGYETQAKETQGRIDKIAEELEYGYVVPLPELNTLELCAQYRIEAYYAAKYLLNHYISSPDMLEAIKTVFSFSMNTDELTVIIGEAEAKWMNEEKNMVYMAAYLAGCIVYALTNEPVDEHEQYQSAISDMLDYYNSNKEISGEVPAFEEYIALFNKDPKKLFDRIDKDFKEFQKQAKKGKTTKTFEQ